MSKATRQRRPLVAGEARRTVRPVSAGAVTGTDGAAVVGAVAAGRCGADRRRLEPGARAGDGFGRGRRGHQAHRGEVDDVRRPVVLRDLVRGHRADVDDHRARDVVVPAAALAAGVGHRGPREGGEADAEGGQGGEPEDHGAHRGPAHPDRGPGAVVDRAQPEQRLAGREPGEPEHDREAQAHDHDGAREDGETRHRPGRRSRNADQANQPTRR